jgi:hypothetical protein
MFGEQVAQRQHGSCFRRVRLGVVALLCAAGLLGCAQSAATSAAPEREASADAVDEGCAQDCDAGALLAMTNGHHDASAGRDDHDAGGGAEPDQDGDGSPDALDECPRDPKKLVPGTCGCGVADEDADGDGTPGCRDACPNDEHKLVPGACGCGFSDDDTDGDHTPDCKDECVDVPEKSEAGACGCGLPETDDDDNGVPDCLDTPVLPIVTNHLGRQLTITTVRIDGQPVTRAEIARGASMELDLIGSVTDSNTNCGGCVTQFYARMSGVFSRCLGSSSGDWAFHETVTFTAPSEPGVYFVNPASSWEYACTTTTGVSETFSAETLATIVVR